jgi:hypothetical protein
VNTDESRVTRRGKRKRNHGLKENDWLGYRGRTRKDMYGNEEACIYVVIGGANERLIDLDPCIADLATRGDANGKGRGGEKSSP